LLDDHKALTAEVAEWETKCALMLNYVPIWMQDVISKAKLDQLLGLLDRMKILESQLSDAKFVGERNARTAADLRVLLEKKTQNAAYWEARAINAERAVDGLPALPVTRPETTSPGFLCNCDKGLGFPYAGPHHRLWCRAYESTPPSAEKPQEQRRRNDDQCTCRGIVDKNPGLHHAWTCARHRKGEMDAYSDCCCPNCRTANIALGRAEGTAYRACDEILAALRKIPNKPGVRRG
jgi:hypothetical protein